MKLKIITTPNPLLRKVSKPIMRVDKKVRKLANDMLTLLEGGKKTEPIGVGLSAVQVGKPVRLMIVYDQAQDQYLTIINPEIIKQSKSMTDGLPGKKGKFEGCLSVPGYYGLVKRHRSLEITYQDLAGKQKKSSFSDYTATIIQHEVDHLNGTLFTDRVLEQKNKLFELEEDKKSLAEITL